VKAHPAYSVGLEHPLDDDAMKTKR
jgi:hypothetical protein